MGDTSEDPERCRLGHRRGRLGHGAAKRRNRQRLEAKSFRYATVVSGWSAPARVLNEPRRRSTLEPSLPRRRQPSAGSLNSTTVIRSAESNNQLPSICARPRGSPTAATHHRSQFRRYVAAGKLAPHRQRAGNHERRSELPAEKSPATGSELHGNTRLRVRGQY